MKSLLDCTESLMVFGSGDPHREFPLLIIFFVVEKDCALLI